MKNSEITVPGFVGRPRSFEEAVETATFAQAVLRKHWEGIQPLTEAEKSCLQRCAYLNLQKVPCTFMKDEHVSLKQDPYLMCPYDDMHTLSEGLLKAWAVWTVVCMAAVAELDPSKFELSLHMLDSLLMGFPNLMIPEVLRRHRFPQVSYVNDYTKITRHFFRVSQL